jgi:hypothetical protein
MVKPRNRDENEQLKPKAKKGRPKEEKPKDHYVTIRLTEPEWLRLQAMAKADRRPKTQMAAILIEEAMNARQGASND